MREMIEFSTANYSITIWIEIHRKKFWKRENIRTETDSEHMAEVQCEEVSNKKITKNRGWVLLLYDVLKYRKFFFWYYEYSLLIHTYSESSFYAESEYVLISIKRFTKKETFSKKKDFQDGCWTKHDNWDKLRAARK